ncbi:MAG TPA: glycogen debranching protein GlgX [Candidatus Binatia bacterium]|nr:glycogen debranching protein GlgX [Candidatus Binatia bacterium]
MKTYRIRPGWRYPFGVTVDATGVNFSLWGQQATSAELLLYEQARSTVPFQVIRLDPTLHRTFYCWHVYVEGLPAGVYYTWRLAGPNDTQQSGFRFDPHKALLDPWARAVTQDLWDRRRASQPGDNSTYAMRAFILDDDDYDWEGDQPLNHSLEHSVIYELHVGGFTRHPSARVAHPGTFSGVVEKISYLKALGVTDVELLPVMAFDEQDVPETAAARGLKNYWGYSTHSFFSPHPGYCITPDRGTQRREFRNMVKALHRAGIGVILDVVLNHTAEGGAQGPTINFKGIVNPGFYHLEPHDRRLYRDYSGCGNTVNCNHPLVSRFLVGCLEYWVREMHVDGFRFDLASVLVRGEDGAPLYHAPTPWSIEFSQVLAHSTLIAEAWDAAGLYQVGDFPGFRWAEWNGRYRDSLRRFVRGDRGLVGEVATRLSGSSDLYESEGRLPTNSINFITCHDGFTLADLVSYDRKHNEANGEDNRDGANDNWSWNCGHEGDTDDLTVVRLRRRQTKNFLAVLFLSQGVPMILAGDEVLRTQRGNNNGYCQDNQSSWFDWTFDEAQRGMLRFVQQLIAFRRRHRCLRRTRFLTGKSQSGNLLPDVTWHGVELNAPLWEDPNAQILAYTLAAVDENEEDLHVILNMSENTVEMPLPQFSDRIWYRAIDTECTSPQDIVEPPQQSQVRTRTYKVAPRSVVVLESR